MKIISVCSEEKVKKLQDRNLPVLAIDLGFGAAARSCGISGVENGMTYAGAMKRTADWLAENASGEVVLILEAPLSAAFQNGNPRARAPFEKTDSNGNPSDRRWHIGAGGAMALAAIHFLSSLHALKPSVDVTVWLVEGFVSRYEEGERPAHAQVAEALARVWSKAAWQTDQSLLHVINLRGEGNMTVLSSLALLEGGEKEGVPVILRLPDGLNRNDIDSLWQADFSL